MEKLFQIVNQIFDAFCRGVMSLKFPNIDADTFWTAVGAIGTVLAVIVALYQIIKQGKERNETLEIEQASKVSAWFTNEPVVLNVDIDVNGVSANATIQNNSGLPVYDVFLLSSYWNASDIISEAYVTHFIYYRLIEPDKKNDIVMKTAGSGAGTHPALAILFRDSSDKIWYRSPKGKLSKINSEEFNSFLMKTKIGGGPYYDGHTQEIK